MELHHVVIRVPAERVAAWDAHVAEGMGALDAPEGFAIAVARDDAEPGVYHLVSVLAERERVFAAVRAAGGGEILLHPLLAKFGAEIVRRDRGTVVGLTTPHWSYPAPA